MKKINFIFILLISLSSLEIFAKSPYQIQFSRRTYMIISEDWQNNLSPYVKTDDDFNVFNLPQSAGHQDSHCKMSSSAFAPFFAKAGEYELEPFVTIGVKFVGGDFGSSSKPVQQVVMTFKVLDSGRHFVSKIDCFWTVPRGEAILNREMLEDELIQYAPSFQQLGDLFKPDAPLEFVRREVIR